MFVCFFKYIAHSKYASCIFKFKIFLFYTMTFYRKCRYQIDIEKLFVNNDIMRVRWTLVYKQILKHQIETITCSFFFPSIYWSKNKNFFLHLFLLSSWVSITDMVSKAKQPSKYILIHEIIYTECLKNIAYEFDGR